MTGGELALRLRKRIPHHIGIARGFPCRYSPRERIAYLASPVYDGTDDFALAIAAHECAHASQHSQMGAAWLVLLSRFEPFNFWLEWRAWRHAMLLLIDELRPNLCTLTAYDDVRRACLLRDAYRAGAFCLGALLIFGVAMAFRA